MNTRKWCACGCGRSVADRRKGTKWATPTCRSNARAVRTRHNPAPGGLQVSLGPAVDAAWAAIAHARENPGIPAGVIAERFMVRALPARQRQRLEKR